MENYEINEVIKMKKSIAMLVPLLFLASIWVKQTSKNPVILKNEVLLNRDTNNYTELRHIVLKGTNEQIGHALGEIAIEDYNVKLYPYADPIYAKARLDYMQKNYPVFYERMKGVAEAYNVPLNSNLDLGALVYDVEYPDCSMVFFPSSVTSNGHTMVCRNIDFFKANFDTLYKKIKTNQPDIYSRPFILEIYPLDGGYSSLVLGDIDLMQIGFHGFNSQGLGVDGQYDLYRPSAQGSLAGGRTSGITMIGLLRMILDTCKSIDEAKMVMLNNKIYCGPFPKHFMIYDRSGNSTIAEFTSDMVNLANGIPLDKQKDNSIHFTDYFNSISVMTNHPVYLVPNITEILKIRNDSLKDWYYDTFNRYMALTDLTSKHIGKFTPQDMIETLSSVYAECTVPIPGLGVIAESRTLYNFLLDLTNGTLSLRFYLRDGPTDPDPSHKGLGLDGNELRSPIFSKFLDFTLEKEST